MKTSEFHRVDDYKKLFTAAALGYAPHLAIIANQGGAEAVTLNLALISAVAVSINIPYLRHIPFLISGLVHKALFRGVRKPSERITALFNEVAAKADLPGIRLYEYGNAKSNNASALKNGVYIGTELAEKSSDEELKGVIAHELSHHKTRDLSVGYLLLVPYLSSIVDLVTRVSNIVLPSSDKSLTAAFGAVAMSYGYYKYSDAVFSFGSRVLEYRADRNAVKLTGDSKSYIDGLVKELREDDLAPPFYRDLFRSHPRALQRIKAIWKEFPDGPKGPEVE